MICIIPYIQQYNIFRLNQALLELQENGRMQMLYNKWWQNPGGTCSSVTGKSGYSSPQRVVKISATKEFFEAFFLLLAGFVLAVIVAGIEMCQHKLCNKVIKQFLFSVQH